MSYDEDDNNARAYIAMAEGYDGHAIIERLKAYVPASSLDTDRTSTVSTRTKSSITSHRTHGHDRLRSSTAV